MRSLKLLNRESVKISLEFSRIQVSLVAEVKKIQSPDENRIFPVPSSPCQAPEFLRGLAVSCVAGIIAVSLGLQGWANPF